VRFPIARGLHSRSDSVAAEAPKTRMSLTHLAVGMGQSSALVTAVATIHDVGSPRRTPSCCINVESNGGV
jgi:hypothetical protein